MKKILMYIALIGVMDSCKKESLDSQKPKLEIIVTSLGLPDGCSSTSGYSSTTGVPCNSGTQTNIEVSPVSSTNNVVILSFSMKAIYGDVDVDDIVFVYSGTEYAKNIFSSARLYLGNKLLGASYSLNEPLSFHDIRFHLTRDEIKNLRVVADIKKSNQNYPDRTSFKIYVEPNRVWGVSATGIQVAVDVIDDAARMPLILYSHGVVVEGIFVNAIKNYATQTVTYSIHFKITSY
jgi:hypothetical protein